MKTFLQYVNEVYEAMTSDYKRWTIYFHKTSDEIEFTGSDQATIEIHKNYNGSGPTAFGGAKEWGHITVSISLPCEVSENDGRVLIRELTELLESHEYKKK